MADINDLKQVSRKIAEEVYGQGKVEYLDEVCDPSFKAHDPLIGEYDLAGFKGEVQMYRRAFPDMKPTILAMCAEGDTVCTRWRLTGTHEGSILGVEPTGKKTSTEGITFDRYRNGKLVESFVQWDVLKFLQHLGIVPRIQMEAPRAGAEGQQPQA
jgi:predicted ester cyclase